MYAAIADVNDFAVDPARIRSAALRESFGTHLKRQSLWHRYGVMEQEDGHADGGELLHCRLDEGVEFREKVLTWSSLLDHLGCIIVAWVGRSIRCKW